MQIMSLRMKLWPLAVTLFSLMIVMVVSAQTGGDSVLVPGEPLQGALDENEVAQVYRFDADAGDVVTIELNPAADLTAAMLLTDDSAAAIAQATGEAPGAGLLLTDVEIAATGSYYVTVLLAPGTGVFGTFELILTTQPASEVDEVDEVEAEPDDVVEELETEESADLDPVTFDRGTVALVDGMQVDLIWQTGDDLTLEVRDPVGETLFWGSRSSSSGGTFSDDVNFNCENIVEPPAIETASWPGAVLPAGSYEILVYYRQACEGGFPVDFTVNVTVDGETLEPIIGTLEPPVEQVNVHISSFTVTPDGTASTGAAGPYIDTLILDVPAEELLALEAEPIILDEVKQGVLTNDEPYQTYTLDGAAGDLISVDMYAISGSLDTLVLILNSAGEVVAGNDDIDPGIITDSAIEAFRLPVDDTYTIVATRYGKLVGGTEGGYELIVTEAPIPETLLDFDLPDGDVEITVTWNTNADLRLLVRDPFGNSVYNDVPEIPSGGFLAELGNINCTVSPGPPISYVYWPQGTRVDGTYEIELWFRSECDDFRQMTLEMYVVVDDELVLSEVVDNLVFNQRFLANFTIGQNDQFTRGSAGILGGSEMLDYQAEINSAVTISDAQTVTGSINQNNTFDLYAFEGQAGDVVTIAMDATSQNLDTLLFLIDPNGVEIAFNDDSNETTNSLIAGQVLQEDGEYIIIGTRFGGDYGGTIGAYTLTLRVDR